jgi:hypothetical protein
MKAADIDYGALFSRNLGVLTEAEQGRIRAARVLIIGDSGSGETLCTALARCGFERITIAGEERYIPSDMNRQIGCFVDTIGRSKAEVMAETIRSINPAAEVTVCPHLPTEEGIPEMVGAADIVIPAVDDLPYSILIFRSCRTLGKPAVLCLPAGALGWVSSFTVESVTIEEALGIPVIDYSGLRRVIHSKEFRCAQYHYVTQGDWQMDWFCSYFSGEKPLALLCAMEWTLVSLAALETVKIVTGRWRPILAPRCWLLKHGRLKVSHFSWLMRLHRRVGWFIFGSPEGLRRHRVTHYLWKKIFGYLRHRQENGQ